MARRLSFIAVALTVLGSICAQGNPRNLDFEEEVTARGVPGWLPPTVGSKAELKQRRGKKQDGKQSHFLRLSLSGDGSTRVGNIMQTVRADPFRGKVIRLSAEVRNGGAASRAQLWLRVDRRNQKRGFFDNMVDRPITSSRWKRYQIVGKVADDAVAIAFGMLLLGKGSASLDNVRLEVIENAKIPEVEGPRPLEGPALENLVAFARLLGYVRYFHPSHEARETDWNPFTVRGIRAVEALKTPRQLQEKLEELFKPIAPTVRVRVGRVEKQVPAALQLPRKKSEKQGITIVAWEHRGMGQQQGLYRSTIVEASLGNNPLGKLLGRKGKKDLPSPEKPLSLSLPRGLTCSVPLALYQRQKRTLPHSQGKSQQEETITFPLDPDDRATHLATVILGWNVFQHFYPYFDVVEVDWDKALRSALQQAAKDKDAAAFLVTLRKMVAKLEDGHGYVSHRSDPKTGQLPIAFAWAEEKLVVDRVATSPGSIKRGDVILSIDGRPAREVIQELEKQVSAATPQFLRSRAMTELRRGAPGTEVTLQLAGKDGPRDTKLKYGPLRPLPEPRPEKICELKDAIWYVDISRIDDNDYRGALDNLSKAKGIIFDFRGYPRRLSSHLFFGHLIDKTVQSAQWHIPIPKQPDRIGLQFHATNRWRIRPAKPHLEAKKVFLTDGRAISYAESCMGIVEHYKLGEIVGEATAGTNGNVNPIVLPGGYRIAWTGMKVLKHDGSQHHGVGIIPTVPLTRTIACIRAGRDEFLEKALEILAH